MIREVNGWEEDEDLWDELEEDGPMDLEDQLEKALEKAFPKSSPTTSSEPPTDR